MKIALYGKGGIGKSTVASNVSAILGKNNKKVLQVGCDPKHDSTIILTDKIQSTLLDMLMNKKGEGLDRTDIIQKGKYGVDCIEIGGPKPGVGCAGRGILRGMEIIKEYNICNEDYDLVIYDILGDVVCGGFFSPMTSGKLVDELYIITSGEFNSLYAANNIISGYINCGLEKKGVKISGIIGNMRGLKNEATIIQRFCDEVGVELIQLIERDKEIEDSTVMGIPLIEYNSHAKAVDVYTKISEYFLNHNMSKHEIKYLELDQLRELYLDLYEEGRE